MIILWAASVISQTSPKLQDRTFPFIMITAYGDPDTRRKALEGGAKRFAASFLRPALSQR